MNKKRRGLSPVIATVLLIGIVVVLGIIIFLWFRGMTEESITKFEGKNVKLVCEEVSFDADYSSGELTISNFGNVPIYDMEVQIYSTGSYTTKNIREIANTWPEVGLNQGGIFYEDISSEAGSATKLILIPVLIGNSDSGKKTAACEERFGYEIIV